MGEDAVDEGPQLCAGILNAIRQLGGMKRELMAGHVFCIRGSERDHVARDHTWLWPALNDPAFRDMPAAQFHHQEFIGVAEDEVLGVRTEFPDQSIVPI